MNPKPISRAVLNGSWKSHTPTANWIVGPMYCMRPSVVIDKRRAAAANSSSGTAVTGPRAMIHRFVGRSAAGKLPVPWLAARPITASAIGASSIVSSVSPSSAPSTATLRSNP